MTQGIAKNLDECALHYGELAEQLGPTAKAAGWRDETTQFLRFEQLFKIIDPALERFSIADLGCGYGALVDAMPEKVKSRMSRYDGYDISEKMAEAGRKAHEGDSRIHFHTGSKITTPVDYCVESGIFNHHFNADRAEWLSHIHSTIQHMYDMALKGIAFNHISTRVDFQEDYIYYADPSEMLRFCLEKFGRNVTLIHDYPLYEFTILVKKP